MQKRVFAIGLALLMLFGLLPQDMAFAAETPAAELKAAAVYDTTGTASAVLAEPAQTQELPDPAEEDAAADFMLGAAPSDMIAGGGVLATSDRGALCLENGQLLLDGRVLADGQLSLLNAIGDAAWFVQGGTRLLRLSVTDGVQVELTALDGRTARELYVVNGTEFWFLTDDGVELWTPEDGWSLVRAGEYRSFVPTSCGLVYATGELFHYDVYAEDRLLISDADGWYVDFELDGGSMVFTKGGETLQLSLAGAFDGVSVPKEFTGYEVVCADDLFTNLEHPDAFTDTPADSTAVRGTRGIARKTLSAGVQNIVKRAYQMTNIQWTPVADITGWGGGLTYKAGTTYTGLPYGQPVYASYVPWSTTLSGFIAAVNNGSSKMYTDQSTYNKVAPYYSCDCSAFVSWAWNLSSRQTTSSLANFATKVSSSSYTTLEVGDALCAPGSHVVLVTDITYDGNGTITGVEISESTVNKATNYCCQKTWYGSGYSYALSKINEKYFNSGYSQYRSKTKDNATYAHVCEVPLTGDSCSVCGYGSYAATPVAATVSVASSKTTYAAPGGSSSGTVSAGNQSIVASCTVSGAAWYQLSNGKWLRAFDATFVCYNTSVTIANKSFPSGRLQQGKSFPVVGDVTTVNPMTKITCSIYSGTSTTGTPVLTKSATLSNATGYTLKSSAIDNALTFGTLAAGQYTFLIEITERASCAGQSAQTLTYRETTVFTEGSSTSGGIVVANGIDVSKWQGSIDWATVKNSIDFAIIRCGYGSDLTSQDDAKWAYNVSECERLGIPYGVYLFSYATTTDMAHSEAAHVIRLLQGHHPSMPVYYDLEDSSSTGSLTNAQIKAIAQAFCADIAAAGYTPGVYSMTSWWNNKLTDSAYNSWSRWVAQFASSCTYSGSYDMWQYTDSGTVSGISGSVDKNYWYAEFPTVGGHTHSLSAVSARAATCTGTGNIAYWYCAGCGKYFSNAAATSEITLAQTQTAALGHNYTSTSIPATCLQYEGVRYTCSRCGDSYTTYASSWSNWSTTRPSGVDESKIQSRTEYRYRDYVTKTSYNTSLSGYEQIDSTWERTGSNSVDYVASWPAGFQTSHSIYTTYHKSPVTASETETDKTSITGNETIGYIYWHWCRGTYTAGPINRKTSTTQTSEFCAFHALFSTTAPSNYPSASDNSYNNPHSECCKDTYWYYAIPVTRQSYSTYRKLFTYGKWGSWSSWGTTEYTADSTSQVETRTTYRYVTSSLGDHTWNAGVVTTPATCLGAGVRTYTCTVCGSTRTEAIAASGSHSFVNGVCTVCGLVQGATSLSLGGRYVLVTQEAKDANEEYTATMELAGISTTSTKYGLAQDYSGTPAGAYVLVVEQGTTAGTYAFRHGTGSYLAWSSGNSLKTVSGITENSSWNVSFDSEGNATIANVADAARKLQFNASDPRFACYTGEQKHVKLLPFSCAHSQTTNVVIDPTCTAAGSTATVCAACGEELSRQTISALGHLWGSWTVTTAATCSTAGSQTRSCSRCGATDTEAIPATGVHTYVNGVCTVCGEQNACSHPSTEVVTEAATCLAAGTQSTVCTVCGATLSTQSIAALGHSYSYTVTKTPTRTAQGKLTGACTRCGDSITVTLPKLTDASYTYSIQQASNCIEQGVGRYTWNTTTYGTFTFDVFLALGDHNYTTSVTAPTCTAQGYTTHTCSVCGDSYNDTFTAATGHTYNANGVCTVCGAAAQTFVLANSLAAGDRVIFVYPGDATQDPKAAGLLTGSGSKTYLDAVNVSLTGNTAIYGGLAIFTVESGESGSFRFKLDGEYLTPSTAESGNNYVYLEGSSADWTVTFADGIAVVHSGSRDLKFYYSSTGSRFSTYLSGQKDIAIYKLVSCAHGSTSVVTTPATCTATGLSVTVCSLCGAELSSTVIPAQGHNYQTAVTAPTCTAAGYTTHTCSRCGSSYTDTPTAALGHSYSTTTTQPTCTAQGYTTHTCSRCGDSYVDTYVDASGHDFVNGICSVCGAEATTYVLTHSIKDGDQIIFVFPGDDTYTQKAAGPIVGSNKYLSAVDVTLSDNTATPTGEQVFTVVAGTGENSFAFVADGKYLTGKDSGTDLTLETEAYYWTVTFDANNYASAYNGARYIRFYQTSSAAARFNTNSTTTRKIRIYRLGVNPVSCLHTNTTTETVPATCTAAGSRTTVCADCGTQIGEAVTLPALGHSVTYSVQTAPTASAAGSLSGTCARCGQTVTVTLPALNDSDYSYSVVHAASCAATGTGRYIWSANGGFSFDVTIPAGNHSYVDTVVAPTCTEQGYTAHVCSACSDSYNDTPTAATGHSYQNFVCTVCDAVAPNFVRVDAVTDLTANDEIILVYSGEHSGTTVTKAAGAISGTGNSAILSAADAEVLQNAAASGAALVFTVEAGANGAYRFKLGDKYLSPVKNSSDVYQNAAAFKEDATDWTVTIENGTANIVHDGRAIRFNYNSGNSRFAAYAETNNSMKQPAIYKRVDCAHTATTQEITSPATCTAAGSANVVCANCGKILAVTSIPALGHNYEATVTEPTCTLAGYTTYTCSRCNDSYTDDATAALGHDYAAAVTEPTCTEAGYTTYTCSRCGDSYTGDATAALGHDYTSWTTPPTCTEAGYTTHTCQRCGDSYTDGATAATGHDYDETGVCTVCGATAPNYVLSSSLTVGDQIVFVFGGDSSGHEPRAAGVQSGSGNSAYLTAVDVQLIENRAITAQALVLTVGAGSTAGTYTFTADGKYLAAGASANALSLQTEAAEWTVSFTGGVPSLQNGERSLYYYSSNPRFNAYTGTYKSVLIYKLGADVSGCQHENAQTVTVDATCTAAGSSTVSCPDCGSVLSVTEIPALGHSYVYAVTTQPTLTAQGKIRGTCTRCDATTALISIPNLSSTENYTHTVTQEPTCTATGSERYALTGTDYAQYGIVIDLELATVAHSFDENGICTVCGASAKNYVLASSISDGDTIIFVYPGDSTRDAKAAGALAGSGSSKYLSAVDANILQNAAITGSALEFTVVTGSAEGTFGFVSGGKYLTANTAATSSNYLYLTATEQSVDTDWTVSFDSSTGSADVSYCSSTSETGRHLRYNPGSTTSADRFSGYVSGQQAIRIYKLVACEHTSSTETVVTPATCTTAGLARTTCNACGRVLGEREIAALGHDWGAWTVTQEATVSTDGTRTRTCIRCGATETETFSGTSGAAVTGYNLTTNGDILVNSYISVPQEMMDNDPDMYVTIDNGDPILLSSITTTPDANGYALTADGFKFPQVVPAKNMQDSVTLRLYAGNGTQVLLDGANESDGGVTYSVQGYIEHVISNADAYEASYPGLVDLCKAMQAYGSYAQVQQDYVPGGSAAGAENALTPVEIDSATASAIAGVSTASIPSGATLSTTENSIEGLRFYGASLIMMSEMTLRFYFTYGGNGTLTSGGKSLGRNGVYYYVDVTGIAATDFGVGQTVIVSDGTNTCTVSGYSVNRYIYKVLTNESVSTNMLNLAKAVAWYGIKAEYYSTHNS